MHNIFGEICQKHLGFKPAAPMLGIFESEVLEELNLIAAMLRDGKLPNNIYALRLLVDHLSMLEETYLAQARDADEGYEEMQEAKAIEKD